MIKIIVIVKIWSNTVKQQQKIGSKIKLSGKKKLKKLWSLAITNKTTCFSSIWLLNNETNPDRFIISFSDRKWIFLFFGFSSSFFNFYHVIRLPNMDIGCCKQSLKRLLHSPIHPFIHPFIHPSIQPASHQLFLHHFCSYLCGKNISSS